MLESADRVRGSSRQAEGGHLSVGATSLTIPDKPDDAPLFSIGAVAKMLHVPTSTLRAWEERYGLVKPQRSRGSQRLYSHGQVDQLRFVKVQIDLGLRAADAHRLLAEKLGTSVAVDIHDGLGHTARDGSAVPGP